MKKQKYSFLFSFNFSCSIHTVTAVLQNDSCFFFDLVSQRHEFQIPNASNTPKYLVVYGAISKLQRQERVDLSLSKIGIYRDHVENICGSLSVLKNIHPSFYLSNLSYLSLWTAYSSLLSCTWIVSMPPVLSVECLYLLFVLGKGTCLITSSF